MANLTIKYDVGDVVYHSHCAYKTTTETCPDCLGTKIWELNIPSGEKLSVGCQTCRRGWEGSTGVIQTQVCSRGATRLTVGQVGYDSEGPRYMCEETGIGSGSVYYERDLYPTEAEALEAAGEKVERQLAHIAQSNFKRKNSFADKLEQSGIGYSRRESIALEREMRRWVDVVKGVLE